MANTDLKVTNFLQQQQVANATELLDVVIILKEECCHTHVSELCSLQSCDQPHHHLTEVKQMTGKYCAKTIQQLKNHPEVKQILFDYPVQARLNVATEAIGAKAAHSSYGLTGLGVTVAVIDTGIFPHYDLVTPTNRITGFVDFINGRTSPYDDNGHGTHVAGAIAGNGRASSKIYSGVAPEAFVVGVKVLDRQGNGNLSSVVAGINWCIQNKSRFNIRVINLSLGAPPSTSYTNDPLAQACEKAWRAGMVVVAAAGNSGINATTDTPGFDPIILTVGGIDDRNTIPISDDIPGNYTSNQPTIDGFLKPDIAVPGSNITSLNATNSTLANQNPQNLVGPNYLTLTGTSMATGIASGIVALLLQAYPPYTPDTVKVRMMEASRFLSRDFPGYSLVSTLFSLNQHYNTI